MRKPILYSDEFIIRLMDEKEREEFLKKYLLEAYL
jgi:hypothetical protein